MILTRAEHILTPNACTLDSTRIGQFRARAYVNMVGLGIANYAAPKCNGRSVAFNPMAFNENGSTRDTPVVEARQGPGRIPGDLRHRRASSLAGA